MFADIVYFFTQNVDVAEIDHTNEISEGQNDLIY